MYLNVGSNEETIEGFVNVDIEPIADVCCDVRWSLPFADAAFDGVYSEHFIEHISPADAIAFLRECRRVTRLGGRIRVATPDLEWVIDRYRSEDWRYGDMFKHGYDWVSTRAEQLNIAMREWGHQWLYDEDDLCRIGAMAGLELIGRVERGHSDHAPFVGLETRVDSRLVVEFLHARPEPRADEPLVSILIPAYRPDFLEEALRSASEQTWTRIEVIVGDDCPDDSVHQVVEAHRTSDPRVRYVRNPQPTGTRRNYYRLFAAATGDYIKYLNDDDVLHPRAVERMAGCLRSMPRVSLVTSHRRRISADGSFLPDDAATRSPVEDDAVLAGPNVVAAVVGRGINWIGEPSTTMFRRADITDAEPELFAIGGRAALENGDVTLWTRLLARGDLCYLRSTLSLFRQHEGQAQADPSFRPRALAGWRQLGFDAARVGLRGHALHHIHPRPLGPRPWWPADARDAFLAADAALEQHRPVEALQYLSSARRASKADPSIALLEARLAVALDRHELALASLKEASLHDPWDPAVPAEQALVVADMGRLDEAFDALGQANVLDPRSPSLAAIAGRIGRSVSTTPRR